MEIKDFGIVLLLSLLLIGPQARSQPASLGEQVYNAYLSDHMDEWRMVVDTLEKTSPLTDTLRMELINYEYGYVAWCIGNDERERAQHYLDLLEGHLDHLSRIGGYDAQVEAYRSAVYGYKIGLNTFLAPFYGPKSVRSAKQAMSLDPDLPCGYVQYGHALYHMPAVFGGSASEALIYYRKAEQRMVAKGPLWLADNWNYLSLLTSIARACDESGRLQEAAMTYEQILSLAPQYQWVSDSLYPQFLKKYQPYEEQ